MSTARIVEIEDVTAGIVVPIAPRSIRFFAAERTFDPLERRSFRSVEQAVRAARDLLARRSHPPRRSSKQRVAGATAEPVPAAPGPFQLPL